jgi:hypothetical protein
MADLSCRFVWYDLMTTDRHRSLGCHLCAGGAGMLDGALASAAPAKLPKARCAAMKKTRVA